MNVKTLRHDLLHRLKACILKSLSLTIYCSNWKFKFNGRKTIESAEKKANKPNQVNINYENVFSILGRAFEIVRRNIDYFLNTVLNLRHQTYLE